MKEIYEEFRYDHPVATVFSLVADGSFQVEILQHIGGLDASVVEEKRDGDAVRLVTRQQTPVQLPGFASKLIPANTTVLQTYEWAAADVSGTRSGTWSADVKGAPMTIGGTTSLAADGDGCLHVFAGRVKASVPLVGGKLESFAVDNLLRDLRKGAEFTRTRLGA